MAEYGLYIVYGFCYFFESVLLWFILYFNCIHLSILLFMKMRMKMKFHAIFYTVMIKN